MGGAGTQHPLLQHSTSDDVTFTESPVPGSVSPPRLHHSGMEHETAPSVF